MKTVILVTARLKSTRLPRKAMRPLAGRPLICHLLDRLKQVRGAETIVICTSDLPEDDPLAELAERLGVCAYRGEPDDVLLRITRAAAAQGADTVLSCTADNPFVDAEYLERLLWFHLSNGHDYSRVAGLPLGAFGYALSYPAMVEACGLKGTSETEVWGGYFTETARFSCGVMQSDVAVHWPELRLTVDTAEDFAFIERICQALFTDGKTFGLDAIVRLCREHPEWVALNSHIRQKPAPPISLKLNRNPTSSDERR